jgi:hypothetical protein
MRKTTITKVWLGGITAIALGLVAMGIAVGAVFCSAGTFTTGPEGQIYSFTPREDSYFWSLIAVVIVGGLAALAGAIAQFIAWIGAIVNSYHLADRMWFLVTLLLGLVGFGLIVMILYLILAPDSYDEQRLRTGQAAPMPPMPQPSH